MGGKDSSWLEDCVYVCMNVYMDVCYIYIYIYYIYMDGCVYGLMDVCE